MRASGLRIAVLLVGGDIASRAADLREVLRDGPDIVYQASLSGSFGGVHLWGGWSDFLHKVARPSDLGSFSYEVSDTKLKREVVPAHVFQLTVYSDLLTEVQGVAPILARVVLGTGVVESVRLDDYGACARRLRGRLESFVEDPWPTRATPCAECAICRWAARCEDDWRTADSLFGVANITRSQVMKLEAAGITTLAQLSAHEGRIPGLANPSLDKVVRQARLQQAPEAGEPHFELCELQASRGLALLPKPDPDDIFYDIEGDPHHPDGGLEYLLGLRHGCAFTAFWAHDRETDAESLRQLFAYLEERLAGCPGAHIYHYAPYEITALQGLVNRHGVGEVLFD